MNCGQLILREKQVSVEMGGVGLRWLKIGWDLEQVRLRISQAISRRRIGLSQAIKGELIRTFLLTLLNLTGSANDVNLREFGLQA